jgi:spoIIIJ-associated protein
MKLTEINKDELTNELETILSHITDFLGLEMEYDYHIEEYETQDGHEREIIKVQLRGENDNVLIGYHGQTLDRVQHLISLTLSNKYEMVVRVVLNVNNYRDNREEYLMNLATRAAQQVIESGQQLAMEPMKPSERRIVHNTLSQESRVVSESEGEGRDRHIVIKPE